MPASQEIWIFGDHFLTETQGWLKKLEFAHLQNPKMPALYIHEEYNVRTYLTNLAKEDDNFIKAIRNEIATTVMRKVMLPAAILIIVSNDILDDAVFTIECMDGILRWLMDEIFEIIKFQWKCLPQKSKKLDEPQIYILKALPKPNKIAKANLFRGVRRKYNANLQSMLEDYPGFGFINVHEITTREKDEKYFISNYNGKLSDEGIIQFWVSTSQAFKAMKEGNKPKSMVADKTIQTEPNYIPQNEYNNTPRGDSRSNYRYGTPSRRTDRDNFYRSTHSSNNWNRRK